MIKIIWSKCSECGKTDEGVEWMPRFWEFWKSRVFICESCLSKAFKRLTKDEDTKPLKEQWIRRKHGST